MTLSPPRDPPAMGTAACPVCGAPNARVIRSADGLSRDLAEALVDGRRLMHSTPAPVLSCDSCGSIFRDPQAVADDLVTRYRDDEYGEAELDRLYRRGVVRCARDRRWWRALGLESGARVLEIGSYVGALLSYLGRIGCQATGVDVGREVSEFARARGLDVLTAVFEPGTLPARSFDSVVVLNCFDQLPDPATSLDAIRQVLRPRGTLLIRTPNADFVRHAHCPRLRRLANAHGVLGVPFVRCLSPGALDRIVRDQGLVPLCLRAGRVRPAPWMDLVARPA
jgi:SAM-dependent methyltransferase